MSRTKDENFMLCLYQAALEQDELDQPLDKYEIGQKASLNPKAVQAITRLLIQANFICKVGEEQVRLTPHGAKLAIRLLEEDAK